jgi:hypothetical protein
VNTHLLSFYLDVGSDSEGRYLQDILAWEDYDQWDRSHDFIQWVFPLPEPSQFNPDAPLLDEETQQMFRNHRVIQSNVTKAYAFAQRFLLSDGGYPWLRPRDHNHLRITRILRFFNLVGQESKAMHIYEAVLELASFIPGVVSELTLEFWQNAMDPFKQICGKDSKE